MRCKECRFYSMVGTCKRYPPKPLMDKDEYVIPWLPRMPENDWCGEFQANTGFARQGVQKRTTP